MRLFSRLFLLTLLCGSTADACNVPVFRYALENWRPDPYRLTIFHREPLSENEAELLARWETEAKAGRLNIATRTLPVDALDAEADRALWASVPNMSLPCVAIQYPAHLRNEVPVWSGPLGDAAALFDSPIRRELVRRLIAGETAVWLFLESGDVQLDQAAAKTLEEELPRLATTLKLPELTDSPDDVLRGSTPLRIAFSLLRVRRDDPAEELLVRMLLGSEADLAGLNQPLAFPVFGRGRSLFALVGPGISLDNIRSSAAFLTGACSCQVKEQNPGFDLLIAAEWTDLLSLTEPSLELASTSKEPELLPIASGVSESKLPATAVTDPSTVLSRERSESSLWSISMCGLALAAVAMIAAWRR